MTQSRFQAYVIYQTLKHLMNRAAPIMFLLGLSVLFLAPGNVRAQRCSCLEDLDYLIEKVEANYVGYYIKVTETNKEAYEEHKTAYRKRAMSASEDACLFVLQEWIEYFRDGHLSVFENPTFSENDVQRMTDEAEQVEISEDEVRQYLLDNQSNRNLDPIEGIWYTKDREYLMAVLRGEKSDERDFVGIVLETKQEHWKPGQVKAEFEKKEDGTYKARLYMDDHSRRHVSVSIHKEVLMIMWSLVWGKAFPTAANSEHLLDLRDPRNPMIRMIDQENVWVSLPSHNPRYHTVLDSLVMAYKDQILSAKNLIIDIRGNHGGNALTSWSLAPFYYTEEMMQDPPKRETGLMVSSRDNVRYYEFLADRIGDNTPAWMLKTIEAMRANPGQVLHDFADMWPPLKPDTVYSAPQNVAILIDRANMSAAEAFLMDAMASDKVTLFGENTGGVIDYQNVRSLPLLCEHRGLWVRYPTRARSTRLPDGAIDDHGIAPDVPLSNDVRNPIQYIMNFYRNR